MIAQPAPTSWERQVQGADVGDPLEFLSGAVLSGVEGSAPCC